MEHSYRGMPRAASLERLVSDAKGGDERAWGEIVERYAGLVWAVARAHRLGDADAADVSQATWMKLFRGLGSLQQPSALGAWLATTARRECLRCIRRSGRAEPWPDELEVAGDGPAVDAALLASDRDALVLRALSGLADRDRALLRMLSADPAPSYEEIGAALHMPIGSIGPTRARALTRLQRKLEQLGTPAELLR
jgi:RNA polymerase sigma factor (sigma-70 family)